MHGWEQPQEAISGIPLLQAGQRATSWDQLVFILFILEPFEEGSCKLSYWAHGLSIEFQIPWLGEEFLDRAEFRAKLLRVFLALGSPLFRSQQSHFVFAELPPWLYLHTLNLGFIVTYSGLCVYTSYRICCYLDQDHVSPLSKYLKGQSIDVWDGRQKKMGTIQRSSIRRTESLAWSMGPNVFLSEKSIDFSLFLYQLAFAE